MTVEDLIGQLKELPQLYEVVAFHEGIEVEDWEAPIFGFQIDVVSKQVLLHVGQRIKQNKK